MRAFGLRGADAIGADEGGDTGERFGEAVRIAEAGLEEALLADERARGREAEIDRGDGVWRARKRISGSAVGSGRRKSRACRVSSSRRSAR